MKYGDFIDLEEFEKIGGSWRYVMFNFNDNDDFLLKELDKMFEAFDFTKINDNDTLGIALFFFADSVLCVKHNERPINKYTLYVIANLECFNNFS